MDHEINEKLVSLKARKKVLSLMGFAARSRNLVTGYNTCLKLIPSGKLKLLIIAGDVGDNTREKMQQKCDSYGVDVRTFGSCEELSHIVGKEDKGLFGITDIGFADSMIKELDKITIEVLSEKEVF